ncbi:MAG: alpha/beta hydrolase [Bacillota bacterium]|nr:alpha/beta hydrolase [Bacillota bacterium]
MKQQDNDRSGTTTRRIQYIPANPDLNGLAAVVPDLVYSHVAGIDLTLQLILPWSNLPDRTVKPRRPLVVFIQGSAWTTPNVYYELPQLAELARSGMIVASITHRNCLENNPFPAFLQDTKAAVRYLRAHADTYGIDPARIALWGTSSGGNAALLAGLTGDDPDYRTDDYPIQSDAVNAVVDCFGPTDLSALYQYAVKAESPETVMAIFHGLAGPNGDPDQIMQAMSPIRHIKPGQAYPSFLIAHGDADQSVPYEQGDRLYKKLLDTDIDAQLICVQGGQHEGSFWSQALLDEIFVWLWKKLS